MSFYASYPFEAGSGGASGVTSLNSLTGAVSLLQGTGITITPSGSSLIIAQSAGSGTVTSVGLATPGVLYTVSGSPITTSGTLTLNLVSQSANTVFAGPSSGSSAQPTFRSLVGQDIPIDNSNIVLNGSNQLTVQNMIQSDPESNYFWGFASGANANGSSFGNVGLGTNALLALTSGDYNIAIGDLCVETVTTGSNNIGIGNSTLKNATSSNNIGLGRSTLASTTTGSDNVGMGYFSLFYNTTGSQNTAVGYQAGYSVSGMITSSNITLLGYGTGNSGSDGITNSTAIGSGAHVNASNQIVLGNSSVTSIVSGTPQVLYNSASPMSNTGDMEYYNSGVQALPVGTSGQLLTVVGGLPAWQTLSASSISGVITVPNGGTGNASFNPYAVVAGGATSTSNLQQVSGVGSSGQVLMSNGAGVLPTWQTPSITNGNPSSAQFITSGTTFTTPSTVNSATQFKFTLIGGGGGGAGVAATANLAGAGGGGGGVGIVLINGLQASTAYTIAIGAAGTGGAAGANPGTAGGDTTLVIGATTYIAGHGSGAASGASTDGGGGGTCTNCTIPIQGGQGGSVGAASTSTVSGVGGMSPGYSAQTKGRITIGGGFNGTGYGSGGSGGKAVAATAQSGGNGAQGAILVEWYN